jgi:tripartite-type tricarboxylate transporter receptor subunit TctC
MARAQSYPGRPVRLIVGFPAGGPTDIIGRLVAQLLSEKLGQQVIVENRPGASGNIGTETVLRAPADGYTLLLVNASNFVNATLYDSLNFDFVRDIVPVASFMRAPFVMEVHPAFPAKTVPDFVAFAKSNPGKINMASGGSGTAPHMAGELFKMMTGINVIDVPYRGNAPALTDLIGGQVQALFDTLPASIEHIKADRVRALAVTTASRSHVLPDVPVMADFVPGYEASSVTGVGVAKNTPAEIVAKLNKEINAGLSDPKMKSRIADLSGMILAGSPADFGGLVAEETEKWARVVKFSGAKPD